MIVGIAIGLITTLLGWEISLHGICRYRAVATATGLSAETYQAFRLTGYSGMLVLGLRTIHERDVGGRPGGEHGSLALAPSFSRERRWFRVNAKAPLLRPSSWITMRGDTSQGRVDPSSNAEDLRLARTLLTTCGPRKAHAVIDSWFDSTDPRLRIPRRLHGTESSRGDGSRKADGSEAQRAAIRAIKRFARAISPPHLRLGR